jgi:hypothetical protein
MTCGLGNNAQIYCWGGAGAGSNQATQVLVPTLVTMPAGVTSWISLNGGLNGGNGLVSAVGNNGRTYVWGLLYYDNAWPAGWSTWYTQPTLLQLPPGATAFTGVGSGQLQMVR